MPSDATPPDTPEVPGLKLLKLVGKGASGEVWTCMNETDTSFSAVKIVRRGTRPEKVWYRHELKALRKYARIRRKPDSLLDIKHVAVSEDKTFLYYTTPVADGIKGLDPSSTRYQPLTLKTLLAGRNPITPVSAAEIAARIAEALQTLHEHGLLHRDVKPDNIIFCGGRAVLADIGLVTETEQDVSLAGTPRYMEPGQTPSVRTDLYALGKVLYEMANGKDPECFPDLASMQDSCDIGIFRLLNDICMRACGEESERYVNASQMLTDLRRAASPDREQGEAQPKPGAGPAISRGLDYHNRADAEAVISRGLELARMRQTSFILAAGLCLLVVVLCQICISSLWPKTGGALFNIASPLKWLCYVAFVVFALFATPRARNARLLVVALIAFCITVYLNGKIAQHYKGRALWRSASLEDTLRWENRQCGDITIRCPTGSEIDIRSNGCYGVNHPKLPAFQILIEAHAQANLAGQTNPTESARQYVMMSIEKRGFKPVDPGFTSVSRMLTPTLQTTWHQCYSMAANGAQRLDIVVPVEDSLVLGCYTRKSSAQDESHKLAEWVTATCSGLTKK